MELIRTGEAARRLGVSDRQVRHLVARGELDAPRRGIVSVASLEAHVARRGAVRARVWEPRTAWAAIELLTGGAAGWLGSSQRSRLRRSLDRLDVDSVVSRLRNRADVRTYRFEPPHRDAVADAIVVVREGDAALDGYVDERALQQVVSAEQLVRRPVGNLTARVLDDAVGQDFVEVVAEQGPVLAGVDLAGSTDQEERALGRRIVSEALAAL